MEDRLRARIADAGAFGKALAGKAGAVLGRQPFLSRVQTGQASQRVEVVGSGDIRLVLDEAFDEGPDLIVRGLAWQPTGCQGSLEITCRSEGQVDAPVTVTIIGRRPKHADEGAPAGEWPVRFSIRTAADVTSLSIEVRLTDDPAMLGSCAVSENDLADLMKVGMRKVTNAMGDDGYQDWFFARRATPALLDAQRKATFKERPLFSIVVPLFHTPRDYFMEMVDSVRAQSYGDWELLLVNASPDDADLRASVQQAQASDSRIRVIELQGNLGIAQNTNQGIAAATGDFVAFLDHDDVLEPDALFEYARAVNADPGVDVLYCDEDKLQDGRFITPYFKPGLNIDLLRSHNYITHFLCVRKTVIDAVERSDSRHDGAQDHDLTLKAWEVTRGFVRVPRVLYHWRVTESSTAVVGQGTDDAKPYATDAGRIAIVEHLGRLGLSADVEPTQWRYTHRVSYRVSGEPLVSVVIPDADDAEALDACMDALVGSTSYGNFEVMAFVSGNALRAQAGRFDAIVRKHACVRVVRRAGSSGFAAAVNAAAECTSGDYLVLMSADVRVTSADWLRLMLGLCQRKDVGAVGAKLFYPDGFIRSAGLVVTGDGKAAWNAYRGLPGSNIGYYLEAMLTRDCLGAPFAFLMTPRSVFEALGGFSEELLSGLAAFDYCLKACDAGLLVVYEPGAQALWSEREPKGDAVAGGFDARVQRYREESFLKYRWSDVYVKGDPYYNPNLESRFCLLKKA